MAEKIHDEKVFSNNANYLPVEDVRFVSHGPMKTSEKLLFDFADLPQNHLHRQMTASEQLASLCGIGRRGAKRIAKALLTILSNFAPDLLIENSVYQCQTETGWKLYFRFETGNLFGSDLTNETRGLKSLRRFGQKLNEFQFEGSPNEGFQISFFERLPATFLPPSAQELKQWKKVIIDGDWESAFNHISRLYQNGRKKNRQLKDGMSIQREMLKGDKGNAEVVLSLVASKTDNAVMILDETAKLEWFNQAFSNLTGAVLPDDQNLSVGPILFGDAAEQNWLDFQSRLSDGNSFQFGYALATEWDEKAADSDGVNDSLIPRWIEFQLTPIRDEHDLIVRWIGIGSDITQRRQAELATQAAKEVAESASRAKSDFLAMMSHEIRTPMNAILGMTELTLGTNLTMDQREYLTTANNSAQALLQILNDILDLSKVEAQRLELERVDFNIADLTRETLDTLSVLAQRKDLALRCHFPLNIHQQLEGDPMRLRQILVNLVGNAIKFTSYGFVEVNVEAAEDTEDLVTLHFSVKDTGVGISAEKTSRIFEAFFQTDASTSRNFGGTGLGLAITSELVRLMGGRIWVESILGRGSTFHFVVTLPKSKRTFVSLPVGAAAHLAGKRILVVDDNRANQLAIERWLKKWDVECEIAETGKQGLELYLAENSKFDLAILDVVLPDMNGFDLAESVLAHPGENGLPNKTTVPPIMMFSSDDRTATVERCRDLGVQHYLIKPVSPKTLHQAIQLAIVSSAAVDSHERIGDSLKRSEVALDVLIVDDHASNRKLMGEILRRRGHRWREAGNGDLALDMIRQEKFDVILMDVQMPEKDGLETTGEIRSLDDNISNIPIIAVTAYVTEDDRHRCLTAGMSDYLAKPIAINDLVEKVERWGMTIDGDSDSSTEPSALDEQFLIQDAPDWATQITQAIVVAEDSTGGEATASSEGESSATVDSHPFSSALARFAGDQELLRMQIQFFLQETPDLISKIRQAVGTADNQMLHLNSHRLKSLVRTYDDDLAAELAGRLEEFGRNDALGKGDVQEEANSAMALLIERVDDLTQQMAMI